MKREFWKEAINFTNIVKDYPCPKCNSPLGLVDQMKEVMTTDGEYYNQYNYPHGIDHIFSGILKCAKGTCRELIALGGFLQMGIEQPIYDDDNNCIDVIECSNYIPKYFYPNLRMFPLNPKLSDKVKEQLDLSFAKYFNDLSSCANRLRTAVEIILEELGFPVHITKDNGEVKFNPLVNRLKEYKKENEEVAKLLSAIKFIGNEGSHYGEVTLEDILDGYEIIELVIKLLHGDGSEEIHRIAEEILNKKSPRSK